MYLSLRARMGLHELTPVNFQADHPTTSVLLTFKNVGGKGAYITRYCVAATHHPLTAEPNYSRDRWRDVGTPLEAGSVLRYRYMVDTPISAELWQAINNETGTTRLKIYGVFCYRAGFSQDEKRLGFCREYSPTATRYNNGVPIFEAVGGPAYNYAD